MRRSTGPLFGSVVLCSVLVSLSCGGNKGNSPSKGENFGILGHYYAQYDPAFGLTSIRLLPDSADRKKTGIKALMDYQNNSTGTIYGAIRNHAVADETEKNAWLGLVDPDNCDSQTNYNPATKVLSFYAKITNKSDLPNDYPGNPTGYEFTDLVNFPRNTTFYGPFYFKLVGFMPWGVSGEVVSTVNTNLPGSACGSSGLTITNDDADQNNYFDCIYPDTEFSDTKSDDPGWDFTSAVLASTDGLYLTPQSVDASRYTTGCNVFLQFQLAQNVSFGFYFDLLGVKDDGSLPDAPVVTSPTNNSYVHVNPIDVTGTCIAGGTVYVEGGEASVAPYPRSALCDGTGHFTVSVALKSNQTNNLVLYQITTKQGKPALLVLNHDNQAPSVLNMVPAQGEVNVDPNMNCIFTFSEKMLASTFSTPADCSSPFTMCQGSTFVPGTITFSPDGTQAIYTPTTKPLSYSTSYTCSATTALTDLAGNALSATASATFTTAASVTDKTRPFIRGMFPPDNAHVPTATNFNIIFSEAINPATVHSGGVPVIDPACSSYVPNIAVFSLSSTTCPGSNALPVNGTVQMSADGTTVTFTPTNCTTPTTCENFGDSTCYGFLVAACVKDLAGLSLASRGSRNIGAYNKPAGSAVTYNTYNIIFPAGADPTGPQLVHVGPPQGATGVAQPIHPFMVFDEPIRSETIIPEYFFITRYGETTHVPLTIGNDPTLQMITFKPYASLAPSGTPTPNPRFIMTATGAVEDMSANIMGAPQTSQFDVTSTADTTAPTVLGVTPTNLIGGNVSKCSYFDVDFSEPMKPVTVNDANINLVRTWDSSLISIGLQPSDDRTHVRIIPQSSLPTSPAVTFTADTGVTFTADTSGKTFGGRLRSGQSYISEIASLTGLAVGMSLWHAKIPAGTTILRFNDPAAGNIRMTAPATGNVTSATITATSNILSGVSSVANLAVGMTLSGTNIPAATTITAIGASTVTMSNNATGLSTGITVAAMSNVLSNVSSVVNLETGLGLSGTGIAPSTTITAIGANTVTMSNNATSFLAGGTVTAMGCGASSNRCKFQVKAFPGATDRVGNALVNYTSPTYTAVLDGAAPTFTVAPANASHILQNGSVAIFFNESMDRTTLTATNLNLSNCAPAPGIVFVSEDGRTVVVNCINEMATGVATLSVTAGAKDYYNSADSATCEAASGNAVTGSITNFTVDTGDDTTGPTVSNLSDVYPLDGATPVATSVAPTVTFSEEIDPRTVMPSTVFLMDEKGNLINATLSVSTAAPTLAKKITITPAATLASDTRYYIVATTAIRSLTSGYTYDGLGGELTPVSGVLKTCFSTGATSCY